VSRIARLGRWLWSPTKTRNEQWSQGAYHCPVCGQELPARRPGGRANGIMGPFWLPPTREELIAKCPFDGHSPYNDVARAMLDGGELPLTRKDSPPSTAR
jgi:hypothetical protein